MFFLLGLFFFRDYFRTSTYDFDERIAEGIYADFVVDPFAKDLAVLASSDVNVTDIAATSCILAGEGGELLSSKAATLKLYPASTTKVMTALLALKYGNLSDMVTVPPESTITETGTSLAGIHPGDSLTLEQLLYGLMLPSGNDAANAIAVHVGGSMENFVEMMNKEAQRIGAVDTHFVNANGLHNAEHYTTAYDLYLIFHEARKDPRFVKIAGTASYIARYTTGEGKETKRNWVNGNRFVSGGVKAPEGIRVLSGKTGTTSAAGSCLVMGSRDAQGREFISVILKAENKSILYENMTKILEKIR